MLGLEFCGATELALGLGLGLCLRRDIRPQLRNRDCPWHHPGVSTPSGPRQSEHEPRYDFTAWTVQAWAAGLGCRRSSFIDHWELGVSEVGVTTDLR